MTPHHVYLIDGTAFCYRAFYAIRSLSTSDGRPTNAVYGFVRMLQALREQAQPAYLAVAFDVGKPTFRHQQFQDYKGQRKPMPDALVQQVPLVKQVLAAYRIPVFECEGYEAEDVLATLAKRLAGQGIDVWLVTGDKDALQLVNAHIKVYNPHQDHAVLDAEAVRARYGVAPEQMVDLMALMGDDIDNIPGVPGIGEKTATQLLQQFGSLERLYEHLDEVASVPRRKNLDTFREQVQLARTLARIDADVPLEVSLEALKIHEPDWRALRALFRELEFKRLLHDIDRQAPALSSAAVETHVVLNEGELTTLMTQLQPHVGVRAVVVFSDDRPASNVPEEWYLSLAGDDKVAHVVRLNRTMLRTDAGKRLAAWLANETVHKLSHDAKTTMRRLARFGLDLKGVVGDTMIAAHLVNPARTNQTLSDLSAELLDEPLGEWFSPPPEIGGAVREMLNPLGRAAISVMRLHVLLEDKLIAHQLAELYTSLELPLVSVLADMERIGIAIDLPYLQGLHATMAAQLHQLTEDIYRLAGCSFNLNSPKQLAQVLFEGLQLPVIKRTKTGASTDSDVLHQLSQHHALPSRLLNHREVSKLVSTYVEALPKLADPSTGRLHTSFNQTATATGRLSSSEPNLQNIPIKTELGRSIRKAFIPGLPDGLLVAADYSQIELRILAHLSGDAQLLDAFRHERDIHRFTASLISGVPEAEVQPEQRNAMKAINYGILYGMTSHGLSKELGISFEEAQAFIDAYFQRYPKVRAYLDQQIQQAKRDGFVQTLLGRRRYIPEVNSADPIIRQVGERMAVNAPIQGTAADLIKRAMVEMARELDRQSFASRMVLQVHDELVFECPSHELPHLVTLVRHIMEGAIALTVPLTVTMKAGPNWLDLKPVPAA